jgi:16S rRNA (guanine527-N7)-methyltransferase
MSDAGLPPPPPTAAFFGDALPRVAAYGERLATDGVVRGLIGPREVPRLWDRHLLNCGVVAELLGPGLAVVDVGSGAGLPGIVLAIARPDLRITLIEPLARRVAFLEECRDALELTTLAILRGRAEDPAIVSVAGDADAVTARAVAPLERLARICLPLVRNGGRLLAVKGESVVSEVEQSRRSIDRCGGGSISVRRCGRGVIDPPTTVVEIVRRVRAASKGRSRR